MSNTDTPAASRAHSLPPARRRVRKNPILHGFSRASMALGPACSAFYDLQMRCGQGVRFVERRLQLSAMPYGAPPLRVGFISDLHYGATSGRLAAQQAWRLLQRARPDLLLLGGDFLFGDGRGLPALVRALQHWQIKPPPAGVFACMGNHDCPVHEAGVTNYEALMTCLEACGVTLLVNTAVELPAPWRGVWLAAVDDHKLGDPQPARALASVPNDACTIMLSHSPEICGSPVHKRCAFTLCGHTHGGQICRPDGTPLYMPSIWGRQYPAGLHRHAGNWIFVSRGVGTVALPIRLWSPPDVAVFELVGRGAV